MESISKNALSLDDDADVKRFIKEGEDPRANEGFSPLGRSLMNVLTALSFTPASKEFLGTGTSGQPKL